MDKTNRVKELTEQLISASVAYYRDDNPIMSDKQYDDLYDELERLESETCIIMAGSPTQSVQGYVLDGLDKVQHSKPMLSADKTKDVSQIKKFVQGKDYYASYKLDGATLVVIYDNGKFQQGITRGNGHVGEDVTEACRFIDNLPMSIPFSGRLELRGECLMSWDEFSRINEGLEDKYSHPRNLAAGTLRSLDLSVMKNRKLSYLVFECITDLGMDSKIECLERVSNFGLSVVPTTQINVSVDTCHDALQPEFIKYPVDGIIFELNSRKLSDSLGGTSHHESCRIALKWADELYKTTLEDIEWNTSKTGLINPVAIFTPVDLDGAITTRATLHNISYIEELQLGLGDIIEVYRSNMVIPKVHNNITKSNRWELPKECPSCGGEVEVRNNNGSKTLHCINSNCNAKLIRKLVYAVSRDALNIDGLSEATIEKIMSNGYLSSIKDIYHLNNYSNEIKALDGFGKKSVEKLFNAIDKSRSITLDKFIYSLSIPLVGRSASKVIAKYCNWEFDVFIDNVCIMDWTQLNDFGESIDNEIYDYFAENEEYVRELAKEFTFEIPDKLTPSVDLSGKTFCITGSVYHYPNRDALKNVIESMNGKVSGSVTSKTAYLINNDTKSNSSKNQKARQLNISIISEQEFQDMITIK